MALPCCAMSGTQALVEIVMALTANKRDAWRALPETACLTSLSALPDAEGRVEITENTKNVKVLAFFAAEAETRAEHLIEAFRAAAPLGASGEGTYLLLVDFQRERGSTLMIGDTGSALVALPAKKARAKHKVLDAFLEKCVIPPPPPSAPSDAALESAFREALAKVRVLPQVELDAAWQHVKMTTMTNAAFAVTKKQEKQLLSLLESPPPHWEWAKVLPLRLMFPREPEVTERAVLALLDGAQLKQQEHWMLLESLCDSSTDVALERLQAAMRGEHFLAAAARLALATSVHPNASAVIVKLADEWLERALRNPELLPAARAVFTPGTPPNEPMDLMSLLGMRADSSCDAMLLRIWEQLYEARARLSEDAASVAVLAAQTYVGSASRSIDLAVAQPLLQRFPHMFVPLDQAREAIAKLHELLRP